MNLYFWMNLSKKQKSPQKRLLLQKFKKEFQKTELINMQDYCLFIPTFMQYLYRIHAKQTKRKLITLVT